MLFAFYHIYRINGSNDQFEFKNMYPKMLQFTQGTGCIFFHFRKYRPLKIGHFTVLLQNFLTEAKL